MSEKMSEQQKSSSFADMFESSGGATPTRRRYRVGEAVKGQVVLVGAEGVFVELEGQQGFFPKLALTAPNGELKVAVGDTLEGFITKIEGTSIELGRRLAGMGMSREQLETALAEQTPVEGKVTGVVKGGLTVDLGGTRAFCPMGMIDTRRVMDATPYLLQTLPFRVVELRGDRDVIVSRRAILEAEQAVQRDALLASIQLGARLRGQVTKVLEFGAFVDIGGVEGLIPTRELTHDRRRPEQVVSTGDHVEVRVLDIDRNGDKTKITLSLKALAADPWDAIDEIAPLGRVVAGKVVKLMDFGAFVQIAPGIEGLLHVSELGAGNRHPSTMLNAGDAVLVVVRNVDRERQRIGLAPAPKGASVGEAIGGGGLTVGAIVKCTVEAIERFGVFVQIEGTAGRAGRGLIRERELGLAQGADVKRTFPIGTELSAKIVNAGDKLELSVKAIKEDEERSVFESYAKGAKGTKMGTLGDLLKPKG
jgi:small subunit ribosomal protein S1